MLSCRQLLQLLLAISLPAAAINLTGYEYIVVGSGAGGGPLAARLALAGHSTLLLEAGTDQGYNFNTSVPGYAALAAADDHLSWNFFVRRYADDAQQARDPKTVYTTPTGEQYVGLHPPRGSIMKGILYTRASTLGGCTAHNALITIYPHRSDWTYIANLTNDPSWLPESMREHYIRLENNHYLPRGLPGHGYTGWFSTEHAPINLVLQDPQLLFLLLGAVFTQPRHILTNLISLLFGDLNAAAPSRDSKPAYYQIPLATASNRRNGAADFLRAVHDARNQDGTLKYPLTIRTNCHVTRVLFNTTTHNNPPKATGVAFLDGSYLYRASPLSFPNTPRTPGTATATREIILSAGVFNTPQILQLSGIGPADLLNKHNIPVLVNLPGVGANLQDNYEASVVVEAPFRFRILNGCTFNYKSDACLTRWLNPIPKGHKHKDRGIYSSAGFTSALIHHTPFPNINTSETTDEDYNTLIYGGLIDFRGYFPGIESNTTATHHSFTWAIIQAHPSTSTLSNRDTNVAKGTGTVNITSTDPLDPPHILFNSFPDHPHSERDLYALVDAIKVARKALSRQLIPVRETLPGRNVTSYEELRQYVLDTSWGHHAVGSCRIGRVKHSDSFDDDNNDDEGAVVDAKFRVKGIHGLRVVDASVLPRPLGTFPVLGVYMLAEKAVGDILEFQDHGGGWEG
ncbi:hypothetical protein ASPBRDRAFT_43172 [Aspergillus brasiliensis CBS 101740]|uniref:Glucose-methanol-choline oxidoreductase N-terminal domain-containing protein n=1 Tax=Aspergillus brasiliensis (strain CBS 101740 / IMI 381727 / IBT 21946) TaxID=767769 RepID=A0A1L9UJG1_ASPBC|nr:hypothetical protein ASPBRDRAFT_43172 [Aspergillus brasiliensis CBS 101740]